MLCCLHNNNTGLYHISVHYIIFPIQKIILYPSEHRGIIDMMLEKKYDAASESMRLHLEKAKEASFANFINIY